MEKPQIIIYKENVLNYTILDVKWMPKSAKVLTLGSHPNGSGAIQIFELYENDLKLVHDFERPKAIKCGTFGASSFEDRHISIGDFAGNLEIFDVNHSKKAVYSVKAHSSIINSIDGVGGLDVGKGAPEIVTGSKDGSVKVWDPRQKDSPVIAIEPEEEKGKRDCWAVAFGNSFTNEDRCVVTGFDNGDIKLFDLRTNSIKWETTLNNGICSLQFDRKDIEMNKLVATTLESKLTVFDMRTFHDEKGYSSLTEKCHNSTVWCVRHLPQDRDIFLTSGGNGSVDLWKYVYPSKRTKKQKDGSEIGVIGEVELLNEATISSQPITSVDWSPDKKGLCACASIDQTVKVFIVTKLNTV